MFQSWLPALFTLQCYNKYGRFLVAAEYGGGRRGGFILVSKGRDGRAGSPSPLSCDWLCSSSNHDLVVGQLGFILAVD